MIFVALAVAQLILSTAPAASRSLVDALDDLEFALAQKRAKEYCRWRFDPVCEARYLGLIKPEESPADKERRRAEGAVRQEQIRKWEARCKPEESVDSNGITHLKYAEPGCDGELLNPAR